MAFDPPDARLEDKKSSFDQWNEHVAKWNRWATEKNINVEFSPWRSFEIFERLSLEVHRGRCFFWFNEEFFSQDWFHKWLNESIAAVGPRYTPELNVELPISSVFDSLSRNSTFINRYKQKYGDVGKEWSKAHFEKLKDYTPEQLDNLYTTLAKIIDTAKLFDKQGIEQIDCSLIVNQINNTIDCIYDIYNIINNIKHNGKFSKKCNPDNKDFSYSSRDILNHERYRLECIQEKLEIFKCFLESSEIKVANNPALLLVGEAGTGKTHLFCDAAKNHIDSGSPAILLLGNRFKNDEPWEQILRALDLSCSQNEFLGALDAAAQASQTRAIIFIDALNEGDGRNLWGNYLPSMLERLEHYPWVAIAISARSTYENMVISEGLVPENLIRFKHTGFVDQEYQAAQSFFDFYGIELPAVPILSPEFQNPLFLRCFCKGLKNKNLTQIPKGLKGITSVFDFFLNSVNEKISKPGALNYDIKDQLVCNAIHDIALQMTKTPPYHLLRSQAKAICEKLLPNRNYDNSLFYHLISEGVLIEEVLYSGKDEHQEMIVFSYERLADHLIMHALIDESVDKKNPINAFSTGQPLHEYFKDEMTCRRNQGLVEALAIQGPEILKKEIFELIENQKNTYSVCKAFIESILWRDPKTITDTCLDYINEYVIINNDLHDYFLNILLTIAPDTDHPYNANFLHCNLFNQEMAKRDARWSIFLYNEYGSKSAVDRLVDWAWSDRSKNNICDDSIHLAGKALIWFLSTSHRFLRDRVTKALVALFTDRIAVLCQVIPEFKGCNDLYVLERLYAVAYGCALRSTDLKAKQSLANLVYDLVFRDGTPPCHILLRDYARGVIEVALRDGLKLNNVDPQKIRPPYTSEWPIEIPTEEELKIYGEWKKDMPDEQWALHSIYSSVLRDGDFARYILGSDNRKLQWSNRRLNDPHKLSKKEQYEVFESSLTESQRKSWDSYLKIRAYIDLCLRMDVMSRKEFNIPEISENELKIELEQTNQKLCRILGKKKGSIFRGVILPYLDASHEEKDEFAIPVSVAQRWIFKRVLNLGWTVERFGKFDRHISEYGRSAYKSERIGKKYQWIAFHEFLAHIADNLEFRENPSYDKLDVYNGPWQMRLRDIDPSSLLKRTFRSHLENNITSWWVPIRFDRWNDEADDIQWIKSTELLPSVSDIPIVFDPKTKQEWFNLECYYDWAESTPPEVESYNVKRRNIWYMLKSYLVKSDDEEQFCKWAKDQNFMGRWMPESNEWSRSYIGEYFWSPAFEYFNNSSNTGDAWTRGYEDKLPCYVLVTSDIYMQEQGTNDCSIDDTVSIYLPAKWIVDEMKLSWRGKDGCYFNSSGQLVAQDPSTQNHGPQALLIDKEYLMKFLNEKGYRVVWTIIGEKMIHGDFKKDDKWPGRMILSGYLQIKNERLFGEVTAYHETKGPRYKKLKKIKIT